MTLERAEVWFFLLAFILTFGTAFVLYLIVRPKTLKEVTDKFKVKSGRPKTINIGGWDIHYRIEGSGTPILLIHGLGASLHCWDDVVPLLSKKYKVISFDLPGFGQSSKVKNSSYGLDDQTERIEKFLDQLKIKECALVGSSMGGNLALWLGKRHPKRFPSVVAIAPAAHPKLVPWVTGRLGFLSGPASFLFEKRMATWIYRRVLANPEKFNEDRMTKSLLVYRRNPLAFRTFVSATSAISDPRILATNFASPILILWGAKDKLVPRWTMDKLMPRLSNAQLVIHPDGGHHLQEDDPEWTAKHIDQFFTKQKSE
jgi:pimeloyl-ACP methyl ester carboxylesterase